MDMPFAPKPLVSFVYEVEKVINMSNDGWYQIQWAPAWVSEFHLVGCQHLIQEFLQTKLEKENRENCIDQSEMPHPSSGESIMCELESQKLKLDEEVTLSVDPIVKPPLDNSEVEAVQSEEEPKKHVKSDSEEHTIQLEDWSVESAEGNYQILNKMDKTIDQLLTSWVDNPKLDGFGYFQQESQVCKSEAHDDADNKQSEHVTNEYEPINHIAISQPEAPDDNIRKKIEICVNSLSVERRFDDPSLTQFSTSNAELPEEDSKIDMPTPGRVSNSRELEFYQKKVNGDQGRHSLRRKSDKENKGRSSATTKQLNRSDKEYMCTFCYKQFRHPSELIAHLRCHTGEQPFPCPQCAKSFSRKYNLQQHLRVHAGIKPFTCKICNKAFAEKANLQRHQLIHAGVKPHQCSECDQRFTEKGHLVVHLRRAHTGMKSFQCHVCEKRFVRNGELKRHLLSHAVQKTFRCSVCEKGFVTSTRLKSHLCSHSEGE